jgi:hypothetical protein
MTCIGICNRYKALRPTGKDGARYISGQKRCQVCEIFMNCDGLYCPCCRHRLRTKPRLGEARTKLRLAIVMKMHKERKK